MSLGSLLSPGGLNPMSRFVYFEEYHADSRRYSRQSIKKYVLANNKIAVASTAAFDAQFNKAIKTGVDKGEFTQPKGNPRSRAFLFMLSP